MSQLHRVCIIFRFSCRRDLIAKHFTEVWSDLDCNQMCDHCYHRNRVRASLVDLRSYCKSLYTIIDNAAQTDAKLTGAKLIDAWYHKGPALHRCATVDPPTIDRYFAEQIVAHLITTDHLKEDFHFTAYSTISYIKRGPINAVKSSQPIEFQLARVLSLPNTMRDNNDETAAAASSSDEDVQFVSETMSSRKKKKKKKKSKSASRIDAKRTTPNLDSGRATKSSEKRKRRLQPDSTADSMALSHRMLDFDDETDLDDVESLRTVAHHSKVASVLAKEKKRRKLIEQKGVVPVPVGTDDDELMFVQKTGDVIDIVDSS